MALFLLIGSLGISQTANNPDSPLFSIGQSYGGGIIIYIDGTGQAGLIAALGDQSAGAQWGCFGLDIGCTSTAIGVGQANTYAIVNGCGTSGIAARLCNDLILNGYNDWFLPSLGELSLMYQYRVMIGGFSPVQYWSSSELMSGYSWTKSFNDGYQGYYEKGWQYREIGRAHV